MSLEAAGLSAVAYARFSTGGGPIFLGAGVFISFQCLYWTLRDVFDKL